ncbi:hypothetical protein AVEN_240723-1 [Araneus ventricosus]|uniref:Uncharacterized protein n=1 Tax=Araneus ventricosus TaxID=182803 RepID=A0A4Y2JSW7_ARAVE|nr:hypothetical protein AVEN_240723-1 [Araneus ventricosus]
MEITVDQQDGNHEVQRPTDCPVQHVLIQVHTSGHKSAALFNVEILTMFYNRNKKVKIVPNNVQLDVT